MVSKKNIVLLRLGSLAMLLWCCAALGASQDARLTATVDRTSVATSERFELTFTLDGSRNVRSFQPPPLNDFLVLSGPNQSTNMQIINGAVSSSVSYSYVLQPRAAGKFTIGPASIEVDGKKLQSQPIVMQVAKGAPPAQGQQGHAGGGEDADVARQLKDNVFIRVSVDKSRAYQGEQITATYKLYTRVAIVNLNISKVPALTGFWSEDLETARQVQWETEVVNGRQFRVAVLKKVALFPQRSGVLEIDPMEVECVVQVQTSRKRSRDIFDQFFSDPFGNIANVKHIVRGDPIKLAIASLPEENVPPGFGGAVGKFTMEAWLDKKETKTNESITLKVKISGRGNLKLLEAPAITIPPDLEQYDPKISDNISRQGNLIAGSRTFEYLLIPRHPGEQKIASFPFTFFDPEKKEYTTVRSAEFVLAVARGAEMPSSAVAGVSKEDVRLLGEDIRFIKSDMTSLERKGNRWAGSLPFFLLSASPLAAFAGFVVLLRRRQKLLGDVRTMRNRRARKIARQRLGDAKKFLQSQKKEEFYAEVSRALWGYTSDKLAIPRSDLSQETVRATLGSRGVAEETVSRLVSTIERCEFARFAPSQDSHQMESVYTDAVNLISTIEDEVR